MSWGLTASSSSALSCPPRIPSKFHLDNSSFSSNLAVPRGSIDHFICSSKLKYAGICSEKCSRFSFRCNSSTGPGGPSGQGENETKSVLDAFFLGKALAEALNERIESTVGEFLSTIGRLQAEQQKQVQNFQEEVLERAKKEKEKAAREAMEAQGLVPKPCMKNVSTGRIGVASGTTSSASNSPNPEDSSITSVQPTTENPSTINEDTLLGVSNED